MDRTPRWLREVRRREAELVDNRQEPDAVRDNLAITPQEPPPLKETAAACEQLATSLETYIRSELRDDKAKEKMLAGTPSRIQQCNKHRVVIDCGDEADEDAEEASSAPWSPAYIDSSADQEQAKVCKSLLAHMRATHTRVYSDTAVHSDT
jgi:hypothetical protein